MELDVYAFGNALVDIQVRVQDSVLPALGFAKGNRYLTEPGRQQEILRRLLGSDSLASAQKAGKVQLAAGGSAANTMYGLSQLGGRAGFCGRIGNDRLGALYAKHMRQSGIFFRKRTGQGMTGTCIVLITDDAQRTMLTCLGVSGQIGCEDIDQELIRRSRFIYVEAYLLDSECAARTILQAVTIARESGVKVALAASDADCVVRHRDPLLQFIENGVDLLFANAQEARALSGTDNDKEALQVLSGWCEGVAVTDGEHGSTVSANGKAVKIAPYVVSAVDTTGAGDAYAAGLLYGIISSHTIAESGRIASFYSAKVVAQIGARYKGNNIQAEMKKLV